MKKPNVRVSTQRIPSKVASDAINPTGEKVQKDDQYLPDKIKELVRADRVHKTIHYEKLLDCLSVLWFI